MAWDVGYMGTCSRCGESIHAFAEDHAGTATMWLRCPVCRTAHTELVEAADATAFWESRHPCPACGTARQPWAADRCPNCGQEGCGEFIYMPD